MLWGNCVPQESLETSLEGRMWNSLNCLSELWLGILITRLLLVEHLDIWDFSPSDARFVGTFLFCLHFERIKISSVVITVHYSVWSWERWWQTEANISVFASYYQKHNRLVRNQTDKSKTKHVLKSRKEVLCVGPLASPTCCDALSATILAHFSLQQFCSQ